MHTDLKCSLRLKMKVACYLKRQEPTHNTDLCHSAEFQGVHLLLVLTCCPSHDFSSAKVSNFSFVFRKVLFSVKYN